MTKGRRGAWPSSAQLATHELVDGFAVDGLSGELRHGGFHRASHVFDRRRAGFRDRVGDGFLERRRIERWRQVPLEDNDFSRLFVDEILASTFRELLDRIA